jgi:hypothetical protein
VDEASHALHHYHSSKSKQLFLYRSISEEIGKEEKCERNGGGEVFTQTYCYLCLLGNLGEFGVGKLHHIWRKDGHEIAKFMTNKLKCTWLTGFAKVDCWKLVQY